MGERDRFHAARGRGIVCRRRAPRAEADAEVAAQLLLHIGRHLRDVYGLPEVDPDMLVSLNRVAAAKVGGFMGAYLASRRTPA